MERDRRTYVRPLVKAFTEPDEPITASLPGLTPGGTLAPRHSAEAEAQLDYWTPWNNRRGTDDTQPVNGQPLWVD